MNNKYEKVQQQQQNAKTTDRRMGSVPGGLCPPGVPQGPPGEKVWMAVKTAKVATSMGQDLVGEDGSLGRGDDY